MVFQLYEQGLLDFREEPPCSDGRFINARSRRSRLQKSGHTRLPPDPSTANQRTPANSGTSASSANSSSFNLTDAARIFSSRCSIDAVPGIGSMIGERCSNQAKATCLGVL